MKCDGKCYLSKLLAKENSQQDDNPFQSQQSSHELTQTLFYIKYNSFLVHNNDEFIVETGFEYQEKLFSSHWIFELKQPPKFIG